MAISLDLMKEITEAAGLPGYEGEIRSLMGKYLGSGAAVETDRLGNVIACKEGTSARPRIMLAAHMDEIGFMVKSITEEGFLKFQTLGGWWEQVMLAQRVVVKGRFGDIPGVIGSKPPHVLTEDERKKVVKKEDMYIDIGVANKAEAEAKGVTPGDPVIPVCPFTPLANEQYLMAKAWDDRFGCLVLIEVIQALKDIPHPNTVYAVGTVQEEVGLRGATTSAFGIDPDIGLALDVTIAADTPGLKGGQLQARLGGGPAVLLYDASMIPHLGLRNFVLDVAREEGLPVQLDALERGGTDAGRIHLARRGVPSLVICAPTRYIHSHASVLHRNDLENAVKLLLAIIRRLDEKALARLL
ncbi:MAG TPA: M42 family metallopeptidase [Firmicutes bacterium]|nr:M42 family metallopeptidase [Bacillota bacterium]